MGRGTICASGVRITRRGRTGEPPRLARLGRRQRRLGRETYVEGAALARPRGDAVAAQHGGQMRRELRLVRVCPMGSKTAGEYV